MSERVRQKGPILIRGGHLIDPDAGLDEPRDLLLDGGIVKAVDKPGAIPASDADVIDASGQIVSPGFIDMHVHLREPGYEYKETVGTGSMSAVVGGVTSLGCMANTDPVNDDPATTDFILDRARQDSPARVYPIAAATRGMKGEVMTEMAALIDAGAVAFSDDGRTIMDSGVMR